MIVHVALGGFFLGVAFFALFVSRFTPGMTARRRSLLC